MTPKGAIPAVHRLSLTSAARWSAVLLLASFALVACGSGKHHARASSPASSAGPSTTAAASSNAPLSTGAAGAVKTAWVTFFNGKTSAEQKIALLQNGQQFAQVIQAQAGSSLAQSVAATVSNVAVSGSTAQVTYSLTLAGEIVLTNQKGQAVLEGAAWKVGDQSFCQLLAMQIGGTGGLPPACAAAGSGASSPAG